MIDDSFERVEMSRGQKGDRLTKAVDLFRGRRCPTRLHKGGVSVESEHRNGQQAEVQL